jgi:hypothetical protein
MGSGGLGALAALATALGEQPAVDAGMACAALGIARRTANRMLTALADQQLAVPLGSRRFRLETGKLTGTAPARVTHSDRILAMVSGAAGGCIRIVPPEGTHDT